MNGLRPICILLVEDDPGDQKLIRRSIERQRLANDLIVRDTGEDALAYLQECRAGLPGREMPDLVLLDLNMPGMGGKEFLRRLKQDADLGTIPVVILTTSDSEQDVLDSYRLHAAGYIKKPVDLVEFQRVIGTLEDYWFLVCRRAPALA